MDLLSRITVAFQGILAGLRPIYLNPDDSAANNNPIPENINKRCALDPQDLIDILRKDQKASNGAREELHTALEFASGYFSPFRPDIAVKHIKHHLS